MTKNISTIEGYLIQIKSLLPSVFNPSGHLSVMNMGSFLGIIKVVKVSYDHTGKYVPIISIYSLCFMWMGHIFTLFCILSLSFKFP